MPETEKSGRRQTSTITVAILPIPEEKEFIVNNNDLEWLTRRGSGPGGQHRNKTESTVDLKHKPTGLTVTVDGRSQAANKQTALQILRAKLLDIRRKDDMIRRNEVRKGQIGYGERSDKRRTVRVHDNLVIDHLLDKKLTYDKYSKGDFSWK